MWFFTHILILFSPNFFTLPELVLPFQDTSRAGGIWVRQENRTRCGVCLPIPGDWALAATHTEREQFGRGWFPQRFTTFFFPLMNSCTICSTSCWIWDLKCGLCYVFTGDRLVKMKLRHFVDVRDVADALLLVYESPEASGRYICNSHARLVSDVIKLLKSWYPTYQYATK